MEKSRHLATERNEHRTLVFDLEQEPASLKAERVADQRALDDLKVSTFEILAKSSSQLVEVSSELEHLVKEKATFHEKIISMKDDET